MSKHIRLALFAAALLTLAACGQPVPNDKVAYVGEWQSPTMSLVIPQSGNVRYKRVKGSMTTSVDAPLRRFEGDNLVVGLPFASTTFEVTKPPFEEAGSWKMVVDGIELTRQR